MNNHNKTIGLAFAVMSVAAFGCDSQQKGVVAKKPRPVEVQVLAQLAPINSSFVTAPVASWKTEQIAMEASGRIEWVAEPNTDIEGRVRDKSGQTIIEGTPIARIDSERYELQVKSAQAQVVRGEQAIKAAEIELTRTLQSQMKAAEAERKRAKIELERSVRLVQQNAGAQSDVDRDEAAFSSAQAQIEQLQANMKAKEADLSSLNSQLLQANDSLRDAQRNLEDCTLYSSFRGQISEVSVVPGSVVQAGSPVAQIQMMDPIKVEVEVSAEDSRRLRNRQRLPVHVTRENGTLEEQDGYLYLVDSVADPQTRTFTLTLLMMNQRITGGDTVPQSSIATTEQTWRLDFQFLPGAREGALYTSQDAVLTDEIGPYLWKVDNLQMHGSLPEDRLLKVSKMRVELGDAKIPFLGNWVFQQIRISDPSFDPLTTLVAGKLNLPAGGADSWEGDTVLFQTKGQWMLRPGDLVKVDLSDSARRTGVFVPMDAIAYEAGKTFLFLVDESRSQATVKRVQILTDSDTSPATSAMLSVKAADPAVNLLGEKFVSKGAHYLRDGEPVRVVIPDPAEGAAK